MKTRDQIIHMLTTKLEWAQDSLTKFQAQLQENPVYALSWSQDKFLDAAWVRLATEMLEFLGEEAEAAEFVAREMQRRVLMAARSPARSSSVTSNLMEQAQAQAAAELLEYVSE